MLLIGYAQGQLMQMKVRDLTTQVWQYMEKQVEEALPNYFPVWFSELVANAGSSVHESYLQLDPQSLSYYYHLHTKAWLLLWT